MFAKRGFTLVEILFVLIIAAGIMAYAVPSYKRAKERSRYEAATGILTDIGSVARAIDEGLVSGCLSGSSLEIPVDYEFDPPANWLDGKTYEEYASQSPHLLTTQFCVQVIFGLKYLSKIPRSLGYQYWIIRDTLHNSRCQGKCVGNGLSVCMCQSDEELEKGSGCFYGANFFRDGHIERFTSDGSECSD